MPKVFKVTVQVATSRPPGAHAQIYFLILARNAQNAQLLACQMAASTPGVVMPVGAQVV